MDNMRKKFSVVFYSLRSGAEVTFQRNIHAPVSHTTQSLLITGQAQRGERKVKSGKIVQQVIQSELCSTIGAIDSREV